MSTSMCDVYCVVSGVVVAVVSVVVMVLVLATVVVVIFSAWMGGYVYVCGVIVGGVGVWMTACVGR